MWERCCCWCLLKSSRWNARDFWREAGWLRPFSFLVESASFTIGHSRQLKFLFFVNKAYIGKHTTWITANNSTINTYVLNCYTWTHKIESCETVEVAWREGSIVRVIEEGMVWVPWGQLVLSMESLSWKSDFSITYTFLGI